MQFPRPEIIWLDIEAFDKKGDNPPVLVTDGIRVTIAQWLRVMKRKYEIDMGVMPEMVLDREYWVIGWGDKDQALFLEKDFKVTAWSPIPLPPLGEASIKKDLPKAAQKGRRGLIL